MKKLLAIFVLLCAASVCHAGIVPDSSANSGATGDPSVSFTWSHTIVSGVNMYCRVIVEINTGYNNPTISAPTMQGVTMTQRAESPITVNGYYRFQEYEVKGLSAGPAPVVVGVSGAVGGTNQIAGMSVCWSSVLQSSPVDAAGCQGTATSVTTVSCSFSTVNANAVVANILGFNSGNGQWYPASPQSAAAPLANSLLWIGPSDSGMGTGASSQPSLATPGSVTSTWNANPSFGGTAEVLFAFSLNPVPAASIAISSGGSQTTPALAPFANPLAAIVKDASSNPLQNETVTFTAPASGQSATFAGGSNTITEVTNSSGIATTSTVSANNTAGSYNISAVDGSLSVNFPLTNGALVSPLESIYAPTVDTNCSHSQYSSQVWLTDWRQKVRQDSGTNPGNACYLYIYGTKNEAVDFQVHYRDSGSGTTGLSVTLGNFVQTSPVSSTINCATLGQCNLYRESYIPVSIETGTSTSFYAATGDYPDVLIPAVDPYWGQTTNAFPYTVGASNCGISGTSICNQSAYGEVYVPTTVPSGYYVATVTVQTGCPSSCTTISQNPVILEVWQWPSSGYMPSTTTLKVVPQESTSYDVGCVQMYNPATSTASCGSYPGAGGSSDTANTYIFLDTSLLLKDHRYGGGIGQNYYPGSGSFTAFNTGVGPLLNGTGQCNLHGGSGTICPILTTSKMTTQQMSVVGLAQSTWTNWQSNFDTEGWGTAGNPPLVYYLQDEPHTQSDFTTVYNNGSTTHGYTSPAVPNLVTTDIYLSQGSASAANTMSTTICGSNSCVLNVIDWLVSNMVVFEPLGGPIQPTSAYTAWLTGSNPGGATRYWFDYQACSNAGTCSNGTTGGSTYTYPNYDVDGTPTANRTTEWLTYFHGQTGELYYATSVCGESGLYSVCIPSGGTYAPWTGIYYSGGWGDGTLLYFCSVGSGNAGAQNYCGSSVTTPLIYPSFRLKMIRDGMQDYEYLHELAAIGYSALVNSEIASWITNSYTFETTGSGLQAARLALGNQMQMFSYYAGSTTPAAPPNPATLLMLAEKQ